MSIFNKIFPWWIPTINDKEKWYKEELTENPKETLRLLHEFQELSGEYYRKLGDFEAILAERFSSDYRLYLEIKTLAQKINFLWDRIEYKRARELELARGLKEWRKKT